MIQIFDQIILTMKKNLIFLSLLFLTLISCGDDDEANPSGQTVNVNLTSTSEATDASGNVYTVGFDQASSNNQNPVVTKKDASGSTVWQINHETTGVDGRATLVVIDGDNNPWVVFTVDGGSNDNTYISKKNIESGAFSGVFMNSYGSGGGPKVSLIARLNPDTGDIVKGTFVTARLTNGNTNSLSITEIGFENGNVAFKISSAAWPFGTGTSYERMPNITDADRVDNAFKVYYEMTTDLSEVVVATLLNE